MSRRPVLSRDRMEEIVVGHSGSGLSISEYCEKVGVPVSRFCYWRDKLKVSESALPQDIDAPSFIPVHIASPEQNNRAAGSVEITFPSGMSMRVPSTPGLMRKICTTLLQAQNLA